MDTPAKRLAALVIISFLMAYFGSPYYAADKFKEALENASAEQLDQTVDFSSVREGIKSQMSAAVTRKMTQDPNLKDNPFSGLGMMLIPAMIDKAVDVFVTPDGLAAAVQGESPKIGQRFTFNKDLSFSYGWDSLDRFRIATKNNKSGEVGPTLVFERRGLFGWQLKRINFPVGFFDDKPAANESSDAETTPLTAPDPDATPTASADPTPDVPTDIVPVETPTPTPTPTPSSNSTVPQP